MNVTDKEKYLIIGGNGAYDGDFESVADEMISLTGKKEPTFLFIGFAQLEPHHGFEYYGTLFAKKGCGCSLLTMEDIRRFYPAKPKLEKADMIFIMGGNTGKLLSILRKYRIDGLLREAALRGAVLAGLSAGAICLCAGGASKNEDYVYETGLGFVDLICCPHPVEDGPRFAFFKKELAKFPEGTKGIASDGAAFEIAGGKYRSFDFCPGGSTCRICEYENGVFIETPVSGEYRPLSEI